MLRNVDYRITKKGESGRTRRGNRNEIDDDKNIESVE
jgi:hypothetical protein